MARYQVVSEDGRHAGDRSRETVVAEYDTVEEAQAHAERATKASKAAEGDSWGDWGEIYWVREIPVRAREKIMQHDGIVGDFFFAECADASREALLRYLKARQAQAIDTGTFRASIKDLDAFELEVLISDLEAAQPTTVVGHHTRSLRQGEERDG